MATVEHPALSALRPPRRMAEPSQAAFTLIELLIAMALGLVVLLTAFAGFRVTAQALTASRRIAVENNLMRLGVQLARREGDVGTALDLVYLFGSFLDAAGRQLSARNPRKRFHCFGRISIQSPVLRDKRRCGFEISVLQRYLHIRDDARCWYLSIRLLLALAGDDKECSERRNQC